MNQLDLNNPPPDHKLSVSVELAETPGERGLRLWKDGALFFFSLVCVGILVGFCVYTVASGTVSPEEKKWAMAILTATTGGLVGYLIRK